ncbi:MAG: VWA domain-containing protein [Bacteroidetes bacterium]|nr:VWA domain-containing protein [Bacteroidota bacterium]
MQKIYLFFFSGWLFSLVIYGQASVSFNIRVGDTVKVEKYEFQEIGFSSYSLSIDPGDYRIRNTTAARLLNFETITAIDLVYTDYPADEDFSELNRKRIVELYMHVPKAFNKNFIHWRIVKQTGPKRTGDLSKYFHGFVVYYRPLPKYSDEENAIHEILDGKKYIEDSTLFKTFQRNPNWKDMMTVMDVTGSMAPYTAQLMLWLKLNSALKTTKQIVFFNDDEENSTDQTTKLDTSGIWSVESFKFNKVLKTCLTAMEKGNHIENNLEAVFYAVKKFPESKKNIIMIADNWEDPCDIKLLGKLVELKVPIRIIVCGVNKALNTNYLDIAYATGGSVHTMEQDLTELAKIGNGKTITFSGMKFKLVGGKFQQLY